MTWPSVLLDVFSLTMVFAAAEVWLAPAVVCAALVSGGLVAPDEFASIIGGMFPIALCGLSSL